jgi:tRNA1(Val) A37 N6-methylase TrmN6
MQDKLTRDTFFNGKLTVKQDGVGYRFSIDSVLLANSIQPKPGDRVVDLGTGCGIVPLIVAYHYPETTLFGIEIQEDLVHIARINVRDNGMTENIQIMCRKMQTAQPAMFQGPVDIVVSNPPFRKASSGRINPNRQRAIARHEIRVTILDVTKTASALLRTAGLFVVIYTSERLADLIQHMRSCSLEPKRVRFIHSKQDSESKLVMMTGTKQGKPGLKVGPPIVIYNPDGSYTEELESMFRV